MKEPYLKAVKWNIYTDWKGGGEFILNDTDALQKIPHNNLAKSFELWLSGFSVGETKRIKLRAKAVRFSLGVMDHPDVRAWVSNVDAYYTKADFASTPNNVNSYQKQNGGDLRTYVQTDVLAKETCDNKDNDCDGKADEDNVCSGGNKDGGATPGKDRSVATADRGANNADHGGNTKTDAAQTPVFTSADGCEVGGEGSSGPGALILLLFGLFAALRGRGLAPPLHRGGPCGRPL